MAGPLAGIRIIEFAGLGPAPFCGMMLADHGATVIRIDRPDARRRDHDILTRSRDTIDVDLKSPEGRDLVLQLCGTADGLIEGFRPGVMERLGLGPDIVMGVNPKLVYGRMTGWGQHGPLAHASGHDINYIALSGALHAVGPSDGKPVVPLNLIGDFGGGAMMLAFGMLAAIIHSRAHGQGQVIDCAMTDGSALLTAMMWSMTAQGRWRPERGTNLLDGGAPFYDTYETADGEAIAIGAIEPQFYAILVERLGLAGEVELADQMDVARWPALRDRLSELFLSKTREEWCAILEGTDACFAPVLSLDEATRHPHNISRETFTAQDGVKQPAPAPRYSHTPNADPVMKRNSAIDVLTGIGLTGAQIKSLQAKGTIQL